MKKWSKGSLGSYRESVEEKYLNSIIITACDGWNNYRFVAHFMIIMSAILHSLEIAWACVSISPLHLWMEGLMEWFLWQEKQYSIQTMGNVWNKAHSHGCGIIQTGDKSSWGARHHHFCCLWNYLFVSSFWMRQEIVKYLKTGSSFGMFS